MGDRCFGGGRGGGGGRVKRLTRSVQKRKTGNPRRRSWTRSILSGEKRTLRRRQGKTQKGLSSFWTRGLARNINAGLPPRPADLEVLGLTGGLTRSQSKTGPSSDGFRHDPGWIRTKNLNPSRVWTKKMGNPCPSPNRYRWIPYTLEIQNFSRVHIII